MCRLIIDKGMAESECFGLSYSPYYNPSPIPTRMIGSFGLDSRNSPHCHFYNHNDTHILSDNLSQPTFSSNSSLDYTTYSTFQDPLIDGNLHITQALQELETALMAADDDDQLIPSTPHFPHSQQSHFRFGSSNNQLHAAMLDSAPTTDLKHLLIACARALSENKLGEFEKLVGLARGAVSISGDPFQRLGAYLLEGLIARKESSATNRNRALNCNEPDSKDLLSYMHTLYQGCPYWKFSYMAANGAIAEACKNEDRIHIIDFQIAQGTQWMTLLQALAERPSGAPRVRITGIDDPVSRFARGDSLAAIGEQYSEISKKFNIHVEFHGVPVFAPEITREMLDVRPGEALAVNFPLLLHHTPDESVDVSNPRDGLLRMVKSLSPKVVTLVEQESNTNTAAFLPRFVETLDYYSAMFESIDVGTGREGKERIDVEKQWLGRDIVNVIACEGKERVERHEVFGKWRWRFMMAGFEQCGLSPYVNAVIRGLMKGYSQHYTLVEKDGAMLLGWKNRNLISASAWH